MVAIPGNQARRVLYSGRVQGVGFRYTVRQIAQRYAVTGFVRNLSNGKVELVVEGPSSEIDQILAQISEKMTDYLRQADVEIRPPTGQFHSFEITTDG
jgi:acylphosphatase